MVNTGEVKNKDISFLIVRLRVKVTENLKGNRVYIATKSAGSFGISTNHCTLGNVLALSLEGFTENVAVKIHSFWHFGPRYWFSCPL